MPKFLNGFIAASSDRCFPLNPALKVGGTEPPELSDLNPVDLTGASHPLEGLGMYSKELGRLVAVQKGLEHELLSRM